MPFQGNTTHEFSCVTNFIADRYLTQIILIKALFYVTLNFRPYTLVSLKSTTTSLSNLLLGSRKYRPSRKFINQTL
jgi:hypothetical protein